MAAAAAAAAGGEGDRTAADSRPAHEFPTPIPYAENTAKSHALLLFSTVSSTVKLFFFFFNLFSPESSS